MQTLLHDLRYGLRMLRGNPGFTTVAVLTLGLGIAAATTVFGWIEGVLLNPFPGVAQPRDLYLMETVTTDGTKLGNLSFRDYLDYRDRLQLTEGVAASRFTPTYLGPQGKSERIFVELVTRNYFEVLGVPMVIGGGIRAGGCGDQAEDCPLAVISERLWRSRYGADPGVIGRRLLLNRREFTIAGVAAPEFRGGMSGLAFDVWVPLNWAQVLGTGGGTLTFRGTRDLTSTFVRLKPGVTLEQARAEVAALAARLAHAEPRTNRGITAMLVPLHEGQNGAQALLQGPLRILMAVSLVLLLIVCANVCNLLLARGVTRRREFGVRLALGAGRWRLARQLLAETLLLSLAGAVAGAILSMWLGGALLYLVPAKDLPLALDAPVSPTTLGFSILLAFVVTALAGAAPALFSARASLDDALKEGGRGGGAGVHSQRLRNLLVVSEVALAAMALIGAGLFLASFRNASRMALGFDPSNVLTGQFYLSAAGYSGPEQREFCRRLRQRMEQVPGVMTAGYSDVVPLSFGRSPWHQVSIEGYAPAPGENMNLHRSLVSPGYLELMKIPLIEGRDFTDADDAKAPPVMIVNEAFVRRYFGGGVAIGRRVQLERVWMTVIGVAKDARYHSPAESPLPYMYRPFSQQFAPGLNFSFFVKTGGDPLLALSALRREARALNGDAHIYGANSLQHAITEALYPQKVAASLLSALGALSLFLAAIGLFSVMSYMVSQRAREVGIRMALGARPADVVRMVVLQGGMLVAPGLFLGALGAGLSSRWAADLLVGVGAGDPVVYAGASLFLAGVALVACAAPALRAARIEPVSALRSE
ncbi:MAG: ABC transporter permease [Bryobacteraceae bacterium]|nr:ABC transporter permease [Bryobacteraceae bacterium]